MQRLLSHKLLRWPAVRLFLSHKKSKKVSKRCLATTNRRQTYSKTAILIREVDASGKRELYKRKSVKWLRFIHLGNREERANFDRRGEVKKLNKTDIRRRHNETRHYFISFPQFIFRLFLFRLLLFWFSGEQQQINVGHQAFCINDWRLCSWTQRECRHTHTRRKTNEIKVITIATRNKAKINCVMINCMRLEFVCRFRWKAKMKQREIFALSSSSLSSSSHRTNQNKKRRNKYTRGKIILSLAIKTIFSWSVQSRWVIICVMLIVYSQRPQKE